MRGRNKRRRKLRKVTKSKKCEEKIQRERKKNRIHWKQKVGERRTRVYSKCKEIKRYNERKEGRKQEK